MFVPTTIVELGALMTELEAGPSVKVVVSQSANPDFFIAHLDVAKSTDRQKVLGLWRNFVLRLSSTPVVRIAKIRGRTRGIGRYVRAIDSSSRFCQSCVEQSLALTSKGVPNGRHKWTEGDHARDRPHHVERAWCERFYGPGKDYGRRAAKALRRSVRL